uniref:Secreted protein n=1 Tax=Trichogramma kaykai TaxID=54128 RepID=A0ABD2XBX5_9HYME
MLLLLFFVFCGAVGCKRAHAAETKQLEPQKQQKQQWQTCARTCKRERKLLLVSGLRGMHFTPMRTQAEELHCVVSP